MNRFSVGVSRLRKPVVGAGDTRADNRGKIMACCSNEKEDEKK